MTRDDIVRMTKEVGFHTIKGSKGTLYAFSYQHMEKFANLVAAAERERIKWDSIHSCHPECDKPVCVAMRKAVADEREACARLLDDLAAKDKLSNYYKVAALLIRERGAP